MQFGLLILHISLRKAFIYKGFRSLSVKERIEELKEKYQMRNVIRDVKGCKDKASQEDVKRIVTLIDDGEYVLVSDSRQ